MNLDKQPAIHSAASSLRVLALAVLLGNALSVNGAGLFDFLKPRKPPGQTSAVPASLSLSGLSQEQIAQGLKEALSKGVEHAVALLGKENGFLQDLSVKIPMPETLQRVEKSLRALRQDKLADDFVATMNRAAERAVPEAAAVLGSAARQITIDDARAILTGTNNAATRYFRRTSETNLFTRFHPIVQNATAKVGVTSAYKNMMGHAGFAASFLGPDAGDIDAYITRKALDGLFLKIAEQEALIRQNPVARTTDLLRKVFGAAQ